MDSFQNAAGNVVGVSTTTPLPTYTAGIDSVGNSLPPDFRTTGGSNSGTTQTLTGSGTINGVTANYIRIITDPTAPTWTDSGWVKQ